METLVLSSTSTRYPDQEDPTVLSMQLDTDGSSSVPIRGPTQSGRLARPDQVAMFARVTSYPPLGQVTCVPRSQLSLTESAVSLIIRHAKPDTPKIDTCLNCQFQCTDSWTSCDLLSPLNPAVHFPYSAGKHRSGITLMILSGGHYHFKNARKISHLY